MKINVISPNRYKKEREKFHIHENSSRNELRCLLQVAYGRSGSVSQNVAMKVRLSSEGERDYLLLFMRKHIFRTDSPINPAPYCHPSNKKEEEEDGKFVKECVT
jgi:hypothetical protein